MTSRRSYKVKCPADRLDRYLTAELDQLSRSQVQKLIEAGAVTVNGERPKASASLRIGDRVTVVLQDDDEEALRPQEIPLSVVYSDDAIAVIDKPVGLVVHPAPGHPDGTLVNALLYRFPQLTRGAWNRKRPGIVHRIDRETSGLLVVALDVAAAKALQGQFKRREVEKRYLTLVWGHLEPKRAAIESPIARDPRDRKRMAVHPDGRYARTEYRVLQLLRDATLAEVDLLTGRTHQIRVHMAAIGHPVLGDGGYGRGASADMAPRQMLHAAELGFCHPRSGEALRFHSDPPRDFQEVLERLTD